MNRRINRNHQLLIFSVVCALLACSIQFDVLGTIFSSSNRLLHFAFSACFLLVATLIREDNKTYYLPEIFAILLLGVLKEFSDPQFDYLDLTANLMGCTSALLLSLAMRRPAPTRQYRAIKRRYYPSNF